MICGPGFVSIDCFTNFEVVWGCFSANFWRIEYDNVFPAVRADDPLCRRRVLAGSILVAATEAGAARSARRRSGALVRIQDAFNGTLGGDQDRGHGGQGRRFGRGAVTSLDLPLDVRSAFQQRVWQALRNLASSTASYAEIAEHSAKEAYAVGQACAKIYRVVFLYRAVRKNGALAGYRWGVARKRTLLEGKHSHERSNKNRNVHCSVESVKACRKRIGVRVARSRRARQRDDQAASFSDECKRGWALPKGRHLSSFVS